MVSSEEQRERERKQQKTKKNQKMNRDLKAGGKIVCH